MREKRFIILISCLFVLFFVHGAYAGHLDEHHKKETEHLQPVNNTTYKEVCGACHFAYQPGLLPAGSWEKIMASLRSHFGEDADPGQERRSHIADYLSANAAENSPAKRSRKIMKSLIGSSPLRITEIPYIREKHHDVNPEVFKRESVGSFANCVACHVRAEQGVYDDDHVKIPQ